MKLGEKIRLVRTYKDLSQENMAEKLKMSVNSYSKIERGDTDPSYSRIEQIAEALESTPLDIFAAGEWAKQVFNGNVNFNVVHRLNALKYLDA
jgi:transcriptional regulator with XRE-family HTH domain